MSRISLKSWLSAFLFFSVIADAASRRREEQQQQEVLEQATQELQFLLKELEDVRVKRWQDKRNAVAAQEAFSDSWNDLKSDLDRLSANKNQKEETLLRLQNQETVKRGEFEDQESRKTQFGLQVRDKINELETEWQNGFPIQQTQRLAKMEALKQMFGKNLSSVQALSRMLELTQEDFEMGFSREVTRERLALKTQMMMGDSANSTHSKIESRLVAGYRIRLGKVFQVFASTEDHGVAILGKTGRLDGKAWDWIEELSPEVQMQSHKAVLALADPKSSSIALLPMDVLMTKATGEGFTSKSEQSIYKLVEREFEGGGWVMWVIAALALLGLAITGEKVVVFLRRDQNANLLSKRVETLVLDGKLFEAIALCKKQRGSVGRVLLSVLEADGSSREFAESRAHEAMLHEIPMLEKRITTMNILAAASPLVGLLGTVTGMVRLFEVITIHGTSNPKLMAGGISEALIATKWGLGVAIPLLLLYNVLDTWSVKIVTNMEKNAARLINIMYPIESRIREHA